MLLKPRNFMWIYIAVYIVYILITQLFRDERMLGFWGVAAMDIVATFIVIVLCLANKNENVRLINDVIELRYKEKIMESLPIQQIKSFTIEKVASHVTSNRSVANKVKTVYMIRGNHGEKIEFSKPLYQEEEVFELLRYCLSKNSLIHTNFVQK